MIEKRIIVKREARSLDSKKEFKIKNQAYVRLHT